MQQKKQHMMLLQMFLYFKVPLKKNFNIDTCWHIVMQ